MRLLQRSVVLAAAFALTATACSGGNPVALDPVPAASSTPDDPDGGGEATPGRDDDSAGQEPGSEIDGGPDTPDPEPDPNAEQQPDGAGSPLPVDQYSYEDAVCEFEPPDGVEVSCAWLEVPEDRNNPGAGSVVLHVARFAATGPAPVADPIVYLEGGPGGHSLETLRFSYEQTFAPLNVDRDLVFFDQRGTGFSEPAFTCPSEREELFALGIADRSVDEEAAQTLDLLRECRNAALGDDADLRYYNSLHSAADVETLRLALGIDEWNVLGISYGTRLAQTVMREYPDGIRSVILDSVVPLDRVGIEIPEGAERSFELLFAACAEEPECAAEYPALEEVLFATVDRLDEEPLPYEFLDPDSGDSVTGVVDGTDLVETVFSALYSPTGYLGIPEVVFDLADGDTSSFSTYSQLDLLNERFFSIGFFFTVQCNEDLPFATDADYDGALTGNGYYDRLGEPAGDSRYPGLAEICADWGAGRAPDIEDQPVTSDIPTLLLTGEFDPITPPGFMEDVALGLSAGQAFVFPGYSHGVTGEECGREVELSFIDDPAAPADASCIDALETLAFVDTSAGDLTPVEVTEDLLGGPTVTFVVPRDWISQGDGTYARLRSVLDPTSVIVLAVPGSTDGAFLVSLFADFLDIDAPVEDLGTTSAGGFEWEVLGLDDGETALDVALTEVDGSSLVVVLGSESSQRDDLIDGVLDPLLASLEAN